MPQKQRLSAAEMQQVSAAMAMAFPNCFSTAGATKRPLKLGIKADLLSRARAKFPSMSRRHIIGFLNRYTSDDLYAACMRKGVVRVDLDGNFTGFVTDVAADYQRMKKEIKKARRRAAIEKQNRDPMDALVSGLALSGYTAKPETLEEKLARLEHWDFSNSMSDNFYSSSGRSAAAKDEIEKVKAEIAARDQAS